MQYVSYCKTLGSRDRKKLAEIERLLLGVEYKPETTRRLQLLCHWGEVGEVDTPDVCIILS